MPAKALALSIDLDLHINAGMQSAKPHGLAYTLPAAAQVFCVSDQTSSVP